MLNPNLSDFWFERGVPSEENFIKVRNRVLYGGRSSSKSHEFAGMAAHIASNYSTRFLCVRRFQNKIKDSVYTLIKDKIEEHGIPGFDVTKTEIRHANRSEFAFYGIERNTDEIKSFEGADVLWIEEAHNLTKEQWDILEPTIRKENSEIWVSFNPRFVTDFAYDYFIVNTPPDTRIRLINYPENPFLSSTMRRVIESAKQADYEDYEHRYLGVPLSNDSRSIIKTNWIEAAIDAHLKLGIDMGGQATTGYDVADDGDDKNAVARFAGGVCELIESWQGGEDELKESAMRAWSRAKPGRLVYDSIGVGAHTGSTLKGVSGAEGKYFRFNAAGKVHNPKSYYGDTGIKNMEKFENLKAQAWQSVADRFRNTYDAVVNGARYEARELISISSNCGEIERLKKELSTPLKSISNRGLDMVEGKKDLAKRGVPSPNLADAFIMGANIELVSGSTYTLKNI